MTPTPDQAIEAFCHKYGGIAEPLPDKFGMHYVIMDDRAVVERFCNIYIHETPADREAEYAILTSNLMAASRLNQFTGASVGAIIFWSDIVGAVNLTSIKPEYASVKSGDPDIDLWSHFPSSQIKRIGGTVDILNIEE